MRAESPATRLQDYLHEHIPLSKAMQVEAVFVALDEVVLSAPLGPNINHRETVFGGSASALAILSAWSLLHRRLQAQDVACQLVIQRNTMEYDLPIDGAFRARATLADPQDWPKFLQMLARKGRARISVASVLEFDGATAGRFSGQFVALRR
jgi:thioesterase domain-containing protein